MKSELPLTTIIVGFLFVGLSYQVAASVPGCKSIKYFKGVSMKCEDGRWIWSKVVTESQLRQKGIGAYIAKTYTCDNLRSKGSDVYFKDQENVQWAVKWGWSINMCFPGGNQIYFKAGHITERKGFDQNTQWLCCQFRKINGGMWRDDFTRVCCKGFRQGSGMVDFDPDYFGDLIKLMNAGAKYAEAVGQVAAARAGAATAGDEPDMESPVESSMESPVESDDI